MLSPTRVLVTVSVGAAAILGWQSYGDAARQIIANLSSHFDWLAPRAAPIAHSAPDTIGLTAQTASSPDQQRLNVMSLDLDAMRENVDRIATNARADNAQHRPTIGRPGANDARDRQVAGCRTISERPVIRSALHE